MIERIPFGCMWQMVKSNSVRYDDMKCEVKARLSKYSWWIHSSASKGQALTLRLLFSSSRGVRISKCSDLVETWPVGSAWPPVIEKVYFLVTQTHTVAQEGAKVSKHNIEKKLWIWPCEVPGVTSGHYLWPAVARQCQYTPTVTSRCQVERYVTSVTSYRCFQCRFWAKFFSL